MTAATASTRPVTHELLAGIQGNYRASVVSTEPGCVAGLALVDPASAPVPVGAWHILRHDGDELSPGEPIVEIEGSAAELAAAEDFVVGNLGFASGVANRARQIAAAGPAGLGIACGGWKKLPAALKPALRAGLSVANIRPRLLEGDFVYIPKNTVTLLGGLAAAVQAGCRLNHGPVAVQVTDVAGALLAVRAGAHAVMVDTGTVSVLAAVDQALQAEGVRHSITIAFGGGVTPEWLATAHAAGADVVDVGRASRSRGPHATPVTSTAAAAATLRGRRALEASMPQPSGQPVSGL
jgi:nicotinate-nucleotide pyrophosphorylase (carboxylating)